MRAMLVGALIGPLLVASNLLMGLKTGWWDPGFVLASVLGAATARLLWRGGSPHETNLVQTTAASVGTTPSTAGLLGAIPALMLAGFSLPAWGIAAWALGLGGLGLVLGAALRSRLIERERLSFPSGKATAQIISTLHGSGGAATGGALVFLGAAAGAGALAWGRDSLGWLPATLVLPWTISGFSASTLTLGVSLSPMLLGLGALAGRRAMMSLSAGALLAWGIATPALARGGLISSATFEAGSAWLLWPGLGLMLGGAAPPLLDQLRRSGAALPTISPLLRGGSRGLALTLLAAAILAGGVLVLGRALFGGSLVSWGLALVLSVLLTAVCARAVGETDIAPLGALGQVVQGTLGPATSGLLAANLGAGQVTAGVGAHAMLALWTYKTGHELGTSPRQQRWAQAVGLVIGAALSVPIYSLIVGAHGLGTEALPAPIPRQWLALGELVTGRGAGFPAYASLALGAGLALSLALTLGERVRPGWPLPMPTALGVAFITPAHYSFSMLLGALGLSLLTRGSAQREALVTTPAAAGLIAGETLVAVALAAIAGFQTT